MPQAHDLFDGELLEATNAALWPFRSQIADAEMVRCALAIARQKRIAAANAQLERGFLEGIGEVVASIDVDVYHRFGAIYGYETVNSPDFLKSLLRDNPEMRVQTKSRRCGIFLPAHFRDVAPSAVDTAPAPVERGDMGRRGSRSASPALTPRPGRPGRHTQSASREACRLS